MSIKHMNDKAITPELILGVIHEDIARVEGMAVVIFNKDGTQTLHCACSRSELALASVMLHDHCRESFKV